MGYSFKERKELSRKHAKASEIDRYRSLLKAKGNKLAGTLMADKEALAKMLYYELLGHYTVAEIERESAAPARIATLEPVQSVANAAKTLKKKLTNSLSTLVSTGKGLMTRK